MTVWGVLTTSGADAATVHRWCGILSQQLDGVVATGPPEAAASPLRCLLAGLRAVPDDVSQVMFVEGCALETLTPADVVEMIAWLTTDVAAVVCGAPVTDALKRIDGDRLVGHVERQGLLTLQTPHLFRRDALDRALLVLPDGSPQDPAALLIATGHAVRLYHPDRRRHGQLPALSSSPKAATAAAKVRLSTETAQTAARSVARR